MTTPAERPLFLQKIEDNVERLPWSGCWVWTGFCAQKKGTSDIRPRISVHRKSVSTYRLMYELTFGDIPEGMLVCHRCDVSLCVNPEHLFLGTSLDNNLDCARKGRHGESKRTHCLRGHPFTPENISRSKGPNIRVCLECQRAKDRKNPVDWKFGETQSKRRPNEQR